MNKYLMTDFEYHRKKVDALLSYESLKFDKQSYTQNKSFILKGVKIIATRGDDIVDFSKSDLWTYKGDAIDPPYFEFKVTDVYLENHSFEFENDNDAKLYFELEV